MLLDDNFVIFKKYTTRNEIQGIFTKTPPGRLYYCWVSNNESPTAGHEAVPFVSSSPNELIDRTVNDAGGYLLEVYRYNFSVNVNVSANLPGNRRVEMRLEIWLKPLEDLNELDMEQVLATIFSNPDNIDVTVGEIKSMLENFLTPDRMSNIYIQKENSMPEPKIYSGDLINEVRINDDLLIRRGLKIERCDDFSSLPKGPTIYIDEVEEYTKPKPPIPKIYQTPCFVRFIRIDPAKDCLPQILQPTDDPDIFKYILNDFGKLTRIALVNKSPDDHNCQPIGQDFAIQEKDNLVKFTVDKDNAELRKYLKYLSDCASGESGDGIENELEPLWLVCFYKHDLSIGVNLNGSNIKIRMTLEFDKRTLAGIYDYESHRNGARVMIYEKIDRYLYIDVDTITRMLEKGLREDFDALSKRGYKRITKITLFDYIRDDFNPPPPRTRSLNFVSDNENNEKLYFYPPGYKGNNVARIVFNGGLFS